MRTVAFQKVLREQGSSARVFRREAADFPFLLHVHPEVELTLISSGAGLRYIGETVERYGPGDLVLVAPDVPHTWLSTELGLQSAIVVQFADPVTQLIAAAPELASTRRLLDRSPAVVFEAPTSIIGELTVLERSVGVDRLQRLVGVLASLAELSVRMIPAGRTAGEGRTVINDVCRFIQESHPTDVRRADAARVAHMSESSFSRYFSRVTGRSFSRYLNEVRVAAACDRLLETADPISSIAYDVGFRNLSNFNRRFGQLIRTSPRAYRAAHGHPRVS